MATKAESFIKDHLEAKDAIGMKAEEVKALLDSMPIPMGWQFSFNPWYCGIVGWIITAVAISLGAPFWFDPLQKVVNIRAAGPKPGRSEQPPADGPQS